MRRDVFVAERADRWSELDALVTRAGRRPERLGPDGVLLLGDRYRATAADLALARREFPGDPIVASLAALVGRARPVVYERERRRESFTHFATTGVWQRIRERPVYLLVAAVLILGGWALTATWAVRDPDAARRVVPGEFQTWGEPIADERGTPSAEESAAFASALFTNNIRVAILAFAGGIVAGLGSALSMLYNGIVIGAVTGIAIDAGNGRVLAEWLPAHGFIEITCFIVAGAAGMRMGWALVAPGNRTRRVALRVEGRAATQMALAAAAWLVLAGLIEGFVSPSAASQATRIAVGLVAGGSFWVLVLWRGRATGEPAASP